MWAAARESWKSLRAFPSPLALHHRSPYSFFRKARPKGEGKEKMRELWWLSLEKNKLFSAFRRERSAVRREKSAVRREKSAAGREKNGQFFLFVVFSAGERRGEAGEIPRRTGEFLLLGGKNPPKQPLPRGAARAWARLSRKNPRRTDFSAGSRRESRQRERHEKGSASIDALPMLGVPKKVKI